MNFRPGFYNPSHNKSRCRFASRIRQEDHRSRQHSLGVMAAIHCASRHSRLASRIMLAIHSVVLRSSRRAGRARRMMRVDRAILRLATRAGPSPPGNHPLRRINQHHRQQAGVSADAPQQVVSRRTHCPSEIHDTPTPRATPPSSRYTRSCATQFRSEISNVTKFSANPDSAAFATTALAVVLPLLQIVASDVSIVGIPSCFLSKAVASVLSDPAIA
jgi:hypothetical protein